MPRDLSRRAPSSSSSGPSDSVPVGPLAPPPPACAVRVWGHPHMPKGTTATDTYPHSDVNARLKGAFGDKDPNRNSGGWCGGARGSCHLGHPCTGEDDHPGLHELPRRGLRRGHPGATLDVTAQRRAKGYSYLSSRATWDGSDPFTIAATSFWSSTMSCGNKFWVTALGGSGRVLATASFGR